MLYPKFNFKRFFVLSLFFFYSSFLFAQFKEINIIPQPENLVISSNKNYVLAKTLKLNSKDAHMVKSFSYYKKSFKKQWNIELTTEASDKKNNKNKKGSVNKLTILRNKKLPTEAYNLEINSKEIKITASSDRGVFYGFQSLLQLIKADKNTNLTVPDIVITDKPSVGWRGMHLDVSRHFFTPDFIKEYIDYLARYKMNVFHWHLVDGPGWRIEIKKYPKLTSVGAWRADKTAEKWNWRATQIHPKGKQKGDYGGFYTQEEIKEIVAYAQERFITIVPEIEMPGHSYAALVAYPEYACPTNKILVEGLLGKDVFCVGNPQTEIFLDAVLDEVLALFPSKYIHIGADEVSKIAWKACPKCQALKQKHGLKNEKQLQSYFVKKREQYLKSKGRKLIGWDEITEDGLSSEAAIMVWRDIKFARRALKKQHKIVLSPGSHCYFDFYQSKQPEKEPLAIGGFTPTKKVYHFKPTLEGISEKSQANILGGQGNVWTEFIQTPAHVQQMIFPRMPALAEALWTPEAHKNWKSFTRRIQEHKVFWKKQNIAFYQGSLTGE